MSFPNVYAHRKVAETKAKACDICFKLSSSVLITPDNKDWFYVCAAHLKDTGFCTPKIDQAAIEARKKRELEEEIERVKKEYEEKQKKKKEKEAKGDDKKDDAADKDGPADKSGSDNQKTQGKAEVRSLEPPSKCGTDAVLQNKDETATSPTEDEEEPRVFELKSAFYQQRLNRKRQTEMAKRNRERMQDPTYFPSVPKNIP